MYIMLCLSHATYLSFVCCRWLKQQSSTLYLGTIFTQQDGTQISIRVTLSDISSYYTISPVLHLLLWLLLLLLLLCGDVFESATVSVINYPLYTHCCLLISSS